MTDSKPHFAVSSASMGVDNPALTVMCFKVIQIRLGSSWKGGSATNSETVDERTMYSGGRGITTMERSGPHRGCGAQQHQWWRDDISQSYGLGCTAAVAVAVAVVA